ncbi:sialate O-acetylesterase [Niveispirillum sp. KHB5.9]|uniref:sialate O-acetylesterase n=1 Tax=Niveispirillum sp. KHB5.9 TaxID=3400269 RepID=UPI003A881CD8
MKKNASILGLTTLLALSPLPTHAAEAPLLHPMFQDHGVLQRGAPIKVWGDAKPGESVTVTLGDAKATAKAGKDGAWQAILPAQKAGGPFTLTAKTASAEQSATDVLVGDVYLCSGQSNMEMQVRRSLDAWNETGTRANQPLMRYLNVERDTATTPKRQFGKPVSWQPISPKNVGDMSAVCYFFGREMRKLEDVPVGLINSAWGGSTIEAWTGAEALRKQDGYEKPLSFLARYDRDVIDGVRGFTDSWVDWWRPLGKGDLWLETYGQGEGWREAPATFRPWESWGVPELAAYNGLVWMRTTITLTEAQAKGAAALRLGPIDDLDITWVNGTAVGSLYGPGDPRRYRLPPGTLKAGANTITIAILDGYGDGGLYGSAEAQAVELADGSLLTLATPWQYQPTPVDTSRAPQAPWGTVNGLSTIHNAMLAPIGPYGVRAALWYQGESNAAQPQKYKALLTGLMGDWRRQFGADLPFLVVQLPEWGYPSDKPVESNWAALRESQRAAVAADPKAGLAVALGVGDWYDIHPANKQIVAKRLVRAAQKLLRGEAVTGSGPLPAAVTRSGDTVSVRFTDIDGKLGALGYHRPLGFELCGEAAGSCRFIDATLSGDTVTLPVGNGPAVRVRYCWADSPVCNLYDGARLPAGPFEAVVK